MRRLAEKLERQDLVNAPIFTSFVDSQADTHQEFILMTNQVHDASMMSDSSGDESAIAVAPLNANLNHVDKNAIRFAIERSKELGNKSFKQKKYAGKIQSTF